MSEHQSFPLGVVLYAYHNKPCATFGELRGLLNYMAGREVPLWDIPRARILCTRALERWFPWIKDFEPGPEFRPDQSVKYVRKVAKATGYDKLTVPPLRRGVYQPLSIMEVFAGVRP